MLILPLLVSGCRSKGPAYKGVTAKATERPLHDTQVCGFFGGGPRGNPIVGCWENEDNATKTIKRRTTYIWWMLACPRTNISAYPSYATLRFTASAILIRTQHVSNSPRHAPRPNR